MGKRLILMQDKSMDFDKIEHKIFTSMVSIMIL